MKTKYLYMEDLFYMLKNKTYKIKIEHREKDYVYAGYFINGDDVKWYDETFETKEQALDFICEQDKTF